MWLAFPASGSALLGVRRGLQDPHNALFYHIMRLVNELQEPLVLLGDVKGC